MAGVSGGCCGLSTREIVLPNRLTLLSHVQELRLDTLDLADIDDVSIVMSNCSYAEPGALMFFAAKIRAVIRNHPSIKFPLFTRSNSFTGWADHIGFFRFIGFDRGNDPGQAFGSSNYTPIRVFDIEMLKEQAGVKPIGQFVSESIQGLAKNLCQQSTGPVFDLVEYSLREILRNAVEHSNGSRIALLGQCWLAKNLAEIIIMDNGVGIAENLYESEVIDCNNNREALKFALMPGITGVPRSERAQQDDYWKNSGFGLFVTSRFCAENGLFRVLSGNSALSLSRSIQTEHNWRFHGTFVQMRLSFVDAKAKVSRIAELIEDGQNTYSDLLKEFPICASTASKMLASQFEKEK